MRRGFTLVELSVVIVIAALMVGFGLQAMQGSQQNNCYASTPIQMQDIKLALEKFVANNNRYPAPSGLGYGSASGLFGKEGNGTVVGTTTVGGLPISALNLPNSYAADCWGTKYTYAVTTALTTTNASTGYPSAALGTITVRRDASNLLINNAAYTLVSHGEDKQGGTPMTTADITPATCGIVGTKFDTNNCDVSDLVYYDASFSNGTGASNYFDDLVVYGEKIRTLPVECLAGTVANWCTSTDGGPCYASGCSASLSSTIVHGATANLTYNNASKTGAATVTCNNGTLVPQAGASCGINCSGTVLGWGGSTSGCSANVGALNAGQSAGVTNSAGGKTGAATATCDGSTGIVNASGNSCSNNCTDTSAITWNTNCSAARPAMTHGQSPVTISNTANGYSGNASASCNNGVITLNGGTSTCNATAVNCTAQTVSWGSGCSASVGAVNSGSNAAVSNSAGGFTGSATASCSNGTMTATGTCNAHCGAQSVVWNTNCSANLTSMNHGGSSSTSNSAAGYSGSANISCTNGAYSVGGGSTCAISSCANNACLYTNPNNGQTACLINGGRLHFASGCQTMTCCNGTLTTTTPSPCPVSDSTASAVCPTPNCNATAISGYKSARVWASWTQSPTYNICAHSIANGGKFTIKISLEGSSWLPVGSSPNNFYATRGFVKGNAQTYDWYTRNANGSDKNLNVQIVYDGNCSVYARARYTGPSSDYKHSQVELKEIDMCVVNGAWTPWSDPYCTGYCAPGTLVRYRYCSNPFPKNGGEDCTGPSQDDTGVYCEDNSSCDTGGGNS